MAKKGQKFSKYSDELKNKVIAEFKSGVSIRYVAKKYKIPVGTVQTWSFKDNHPELNFKNKRGRKKNPVTLEDYKERYEILKKYQAFLKAQREKK